MKILHIIDHVGMGGAQTILKGVFEKKNDNKNIYCYALRNNTIKVEIDHPNVYSYKFYSKLNIRSLFELKKIIKTQNIDVLHCHLAKSMVFGYLLKILFFKNIKLVFHEHGKIFQNRNWYNYFIRMSQNKVDLYVAVSRATKDKLINDANISSDKIEVLYNFVDLSKFNTESIEKYRIDEPREKLGNRKSDFVIGFAGRLSKVKGCDLLIKSVPYINIPNFKLLIAGDGPEKNNLEKLAKELGVEDKVIFCGYIKDIIKFYGLIDWFVLSSRSEASPMAFYEIQALGIPIIANNIIALREFIKDRKNGLLFQENNEKSLAEKINLVYNNPELRAQLIIHGIIDIKQYSLDNYINELDKIHKSLYYV